MEYGFRRYINTPRYFIDIFPEDDSVPDLARDKLAKWARSAWRRTSTLDTVRTVGLVLGLLEEEFTYTTKFEPAQEQGEAYEIGYRIGLEERQRRLKAAGLDSATVDKKITTIERMDALLQSFMPPVPAKERAAQMGLRIVGGD